MQFSPLPGEGRARYAATGPSLRTWTLALLLAGMTLLSACGGGGNSAASATQPPAALAYATPDAVYVVGEAIAPNTPQVGGGPVAAFTVSPALPAGLELHAQTGAITGTPSAIEAQATYTVTARNAAGSTSVQLRIAVTARGNWVSTAPLLPARHYASVSTLQDGKALAAGGFTNAGVTSGTALYDPAAGTWTPAASMAISRSEHTATVLADGRVLVVGGQAAALGAATATAEIYDPAAGTWVATAAMNEPRMRHTATLLPDGKVLVIGGYDPASGLTFRDTAERYDPATGTWTLLNTRLAFARGQHAAEVLPGGAAVLVAAGVSNLGFIATAELFPLDDSGTTTTLPAQGGSGTVAQSVRLADGSVLVTTEGTTAWRFHPATSTWTTSILSAARLLPVMTALADGRVLLAGGTNLASAEIYDPGTNAWTAAATMATARRAAAATLLQDGSVLVVGGFNNAVGEVDGVERYRP